MIPLTRSYSGSLGMTESFPSITDNKMKLTIHIIKMIYIYECYLPMVAAEYTRWVHL